MIYYLIRHVGNLNHYLIEWKLDIGGIEFPLAKKLKLKNHMFL